MIIHVLRNGTITTDMKGHLVKQSEVPQVYEIINQLRRKGNGDLRRNQKSK